MKYIIEALKSDHKKSDFSCGYISLDNYIKKQAKQDMKRHISAVFVASIDGIVSGYYTLSGDSIEYDDVPENIKKKMPSYDKLPVTLLGRLAVDIKSQGQKIGQNLLIDALKRSLRISKSEIGSIAVVVDPIDKKAQSFYEQYGFISLPDSKRMFLPMGTIKSLNINL